jgi:hypothetical protein
MARASLENSPLNWNFLPSLSSWSLAIIFLLLWNSLQECTHPFYPPCSFFMILRNVCSVETCMPAYDSLSQLAGERQPRLLVPAKILFSYGHILNFLPFRLQLVIVFWGEKRYGTFFICSSRSACPVLATLCPGKLTHTDYVTNAMSSGFWLVCPGSGSNGRQGAGRRESSVLILPHCYRLDTSITEGSVCCWLVFLQWLSLGSRSY